MTLFEYLTVAVSIVLSLAVVRIFGGIRSAMDRASRYWIHFVWLFLILYACALFWWVLWGARGAAWNFPLFLYILIGPGLLYMQASALVPENPDGVASWRNQFLAVRRYFFSINALVTAHVTLDPWLIAGEVLPVPTLVIQSTLVAISVIGAVSARPAIQAAITIMFAGSALVGIVALAFAPM